MNPEASKWTEKGKSQNEITINQLILLIYHDAFRLTFDANNIGFI